jgi:hypothetical protein
LWAVAGRRPAAATERRPTWHHSRRGRVGLGLLRRQLRGRLRKSLGVPKERALTTRKPFALGAAEFGRAHLQPRDGARCAASFNFHVRSPYESRASFGNCLACHLLFPRRVGIRRRVPPRCPLASLSRPAVSLGCSVASSPLRGRHARLALRPAEPRLARLRVTTRPSGFQGVYTETSAKRRPISTRPL